jgi:HK97 family phage major capsid protein
VPIKSKPAATAGDFSLVNLIRANLQDSTLRPGEGDRELQMVADAKREFANFNQAPIRGHVLPLHRAEAGGLSSGILADGGALVHTGRVTLAAALQPVLMLERLGARRVTMEGGDNLVSAAATSGGGWVTEDGDSIQETALFGSAMRAPREAAARLRMSRRLFNQSVISEAEFRLMLQRTISATVESGILAGTGSNGQPMGLLNDQSLQQETYTSTTALPTREKAAEFVGDILQADGDLEQVQILLSAADYEDSQRFVDPTAGDRPLVEFSEGRRRLAGVPVAFSPYVSTGNLVVADWSRVAISYVGPPQLIINPYKYSESGTLELTLFQMVGYAVERRELLTVAKLTA